MWEPGKKKDRISYLWTYDLYGPYVMLWMRENPLRGQVGGGWALEIQPFLGPVKWHQAVRRAPFGAQKSRDFQCPAPSHLPKEVMDLPASKHYVQGRVNQRSIGIFMYMSFNLLP
jgi:hypothetical protein